MCNFAAVFYILDVLYKMNVITKTLQLADGRTITIETGKVAKQTDGAVMLKMSHCLCRKRCSSRNRFYAFAGRLS